jgi:hypothetical protein
LKISKIIKQLNLLKVSMVNVIVWLMTKFF